MGALTIVPIFHGWLTQGPASPVMAMCFMVVITIPLALVTGPQTAMLAELFPARTRYSAAALPHNLAAGWIGGLLPFLITLINDQVGSPLAGLWYPTLLLVIAFVVGLRYLPETRGTDLRR
jgi:Sugar (and other) transporter